MCTYLYFSLIQRKLIATPRNSHGTFYLTIFPRLRLCTYDTPRYSDAVCMIYCLEIFTATHLGR